MNDAPANFAQLPFMPLGREFGLLTKAYFGVLANKMSGAGPDRYFSVLIAIEKAQGSCTQQSLCSELAIDKVSMVRIMNYFISKKWIKKERDKSDRRAYNILLTATGKKIMPELYELVEEVNNVAWQGFSASAKATFLKQLRQISDNLSGLPATPIHLDYRQAKTGKR